MKPFEIYAQAHYARQTEPSYHGEFTLHGVEITMFGSPDDPLGERVVRTITDLAQLEPLAAECAAAFGRSCVVFMGPTDRRARKPRGFEAAISAASERFRDVPPKAVAS